MAARIEPKTSTAFTPKDRSNLTELRLKYFQSVPSLMGELRDVFKEVVKARAQSPSLADMHLKISSLSNDAITTGLNAISALGSVLAALLKDHIVHPNALSASEQRTVAQCIDVIAHLFHFAENDLLFELDNPLILVVDDEKLSRKTMMHSLKRINFNPLVVGDPVVAAALLEENAFDLILLDVMMPGIDGYELCKKIRQFPINKRTPVIFVTAAGEFNSRVKSVHVGGDDFIAKPFHHLELAVKAQTLLLRQKLI